MPHFYLLLNGVLFLDIFVNVNSEEHFWYFVQNIKYFVFIQNVIGLSIAVTWFAVFN